MNPVWKLVSAGIYIYLYTWYYIRSLPSWYRYEADIIGCDTSLVGSLIPMLIPDRRLHTGLITLVFSSVGWFSDYVLFRLFYFLIFFQVVTSLRNTWNRDPLLEESTRAIATCQQLVNPVTSSLLLCSWKKKEQTTTLNLNSYCNLQHCFMFTATT
jgi:hypothetical protein